MTPLLFSLFTLWLAEGAFVFCWPSAYAAFTAWIIRGPRMLLRVKSLVLLVVSGWLLILAWASSPEWAFLINLISLPVLFWGLLQASVSVAGQEVRAAFDEMQEKSRSGGLRPHAITLGGIGAVGLLAMAAFAF